MFSRVCVSCSTFLRQCKDMQVRYKNTPASRFSQIQNFESDPKQTSGKCTQTQYAWINFLKERPDPKGTVRPIWTDPKIASRIKLIASLLESLWESDILVYRLETCDNTTVAYPTWLEWVPCPSRVPAPGQILVTRKHMDLLRPPLLPLPSTKELFLLAFYSGISGLNLQCWTFVSPFWQWD